MKEHQSPYRWVILCIGILAYSIAYVQRMSPTVMADAIMTEFAVSGTFMGLLASAYFYPYAFMQIPSGILSDKYPARKLIGTSLFAASVGTLIFAIAPNMYIAFIGRLLIGLGVSVILMPAYKLLANWFSPKAYVIAMSAVAALAGGFGSIFAGTPLALLVEMHGWREVNIWIALGTFAIGVIVFLFIKDFPKKENQSTISIQKHKEVVDAADKVINYSLPTETKLGIVASIKIVLSKGNYWVFAISFFVNGAIMFSFAGLWAGLYYMDVCGFTRVEMSNLLSYGSALSIFTPIVFAMLAAKIQARNLVIFILNISVLILCAWLYLRNGVWLKTEIYIWAIIFPTIFLMAPAFFFAGIRDIFPSNISGTASGLLYTAPMIASAIYQPFIGYLLDKAGFITILTAEMFTPVTELYLVSAGLTVIATFVLKTKNGQFV